MLDKTGMSKDIRLNTKFANRIIVSTARSFWGSRSWRGEKKSKTLGKIKGKQQNQRDVLF